VRQRALGRAIQCLLLAAALDAKAEPATTPDASAVRPRLALALSGGGARGIAHVGALRALEEAGIPVDAIAGNSMGAVLGAIYATGRSTAELDAIVRTLDWSSLFSGRPDRRTLPVVRHDEHGDLLGVSFDRGGARLAPGLLDEHRVNRFLIEHLAPANYASGGDFDQLPIPFRAVATDLASGDSVVLARGDLARAVRASMSIPVFFPPVEWEGRQLVDGLVVSNLPTDVARTFGAAVTVAIDVGSPDLEPEEYATSFGVASQVSRLLSARRNQDFEAEPDVYVRPDLGKHPSTAYSGFDALIRAGHQATRQAVPLIRERLAAAGVASLSPRSSQVPERQLEGTPIVEVVARGNDRVSERLLRRTFNIPLGSGYSMQRGLRAFDRVDATGLLARSWMSSSPSRTASGSCCARRRQPGTGRRSRCATASGRRPASPCACATRTRWASESTWSCCSPPATPRRWPRGPCAENACSWPGSAIARRPTP